MSVVRNASSLPGERRKSARSSVGGHCVELIYGGDGTTAIYDSKNPTGPAFQFGAGEVQRFIARVRNGEFDRPHA